MIDRLKALEKLDRKRLDAALMRIQGRPVLMTLFNLGLVGINSLSNVKRFIKLGLNKLKIINLDPATSNDSFNFLPDAFENRVINSHLSVLIVCEVTIPQCLRYRVEQKIEQLEMRGLPCKWLNWTDYFEVKNQIHFHDVIIFYRVPGYPKATANIDYAAKLGKIVIYDTDDLIYDRQTLNSYYSKSTGQLSAKELQAVLKGADLYKLAISKCHYAITTTEELKQSLEQILGEGNVFILPNALDKHSLTVAKNMAPIKTDGKLTLFYGSGSKTHDEDFAMIADVLADLFAKYDELQLLVVGYLSMPEKLIAYKKRITQIKFLHLDEYLHVLSHADINLAPLTPGLFADCKSEIKWLEAGVLNIPTIASPTSVYQRAIKNEHDGLIAQDAAQWMQYLEHLITDNAFRLQLGRAAARSAYENYSPEKISTRFSEILSEIKHKQCVEKGYQLSTDQQKHVVVVNVLYPPLAMGGATVVAENIVNAVANDYKDSFRVSVFTCDIENIYAYQLKEYEHCGVSVTAVSVPVGPEVDYRPFDDYIEKIFAEYLRFQKPDVIHFHSIQRLTASMLRAAISLDIPFLVTVHDAWWMSDHQFLVDAEGEPVSTMQSNPIVAVKTSDDVQRTLERSTNLKKLLNKAVQVLAVSDYQAQFYRQNGVNNVITNTNGVNALDVPDKAQIPSEKVVLGYSGSICHHKGYYFLKQVIENALLQNLKLKVIQFDLGESRIENWNDVEVEFLPKFKADNMSEFYQQIDILIAPSLWPESFGLITREAAMSGLWVIASEAGGLAELVVSGKNGFTFELGNAEQLHEILKLIDAQPQRYKQRVAAEDRNIDSINSVDEQVAQLVQIYRNSCNSKRLN